MRRRASLWATLALASAWACGDPPAATEGSASSGASETGPGQVSFPQTAATGDPTGATGTDPAIDQGDPDRTIRFAVIGDFGSDLPPEAEVAGLVASREPEFVITLGDNNYFDGLASTIDKNIGKYYHAFIGHYRGEFGPGSGVSRFFPCPGNHDWNSGTLQPYTDYFALPGNERYYELRRGPVHFFALDSDPHEPDGITADSAQAAWLEQALMASDAPFKLVYFHHPPYSSGYHRGTAAMRWPFRAWGADLVLNGHDHHYERLVVDDLLYVVNGSGGAALRTLSGEEVGTQRATPDVFGAMFVQADPQQMTLSFVDTAGGVVDRVTLLAEPPAGWSTLLPLGSTWRWLQADPGAGWTDPLTDDSGWSEGQAPLGVGIGGEVTTIPPARVTYFRRAFEADQVGGPLRLRIAADDGVVVYLNGTEVYRLNMPEGPIGPESFAATAVGWWYEDRLSETIVPGEALRPGKNLLAVELHQHSVTSGDIRLELELARAQ